MHAQWVLRNASSQWTFKHRSSLLALPTSMGKQHSNMTCVHQVFLFTNAIFFSAVLPPTKELRFHEMGGSPSYWSISNLQAEAGAREGTGSCRSLVKRRRRRTKVSFPLVYGVQDEYRLCGRVVLPMPRGEENSTRNSTCLPSTLVVLCSPDSTRTSRLGML